jgi:putative oxidoreductase
MEMERVRDLGTMPARFALGSTMLYHGVAKLQGEGPTQTAQMFGQLGLPKPKLSAIATGLAECFAGVAAIAGVATRPAAVAVLVTQAVAIAKVHAKNGFSIQDGGFEFNLALMAIAAGLLIGGPGVWSAHGALERSVAGRRRRRPWLRARRPFGLAAIKALK